MYYLKYFLEVLSRDHTPTEPIKGSTPQRNHPLIQLTPLSFTVCWWLRYLFGGLSQDVARDIMKRSTPDMGGGILLPWGGACPLLSIDIHE